MIISIKEEFYKWIVNWEEKINEDEWYFVQLREKIINEITSEQAYKLISEAVELVFEQNDPWLLGECFELLISLCFKSNTTEMPRRLLTDWERLEKFVASNGEYYKTRFTHLKRWFRK